MTLTQTPIEGLLIPEPKVYPDSRGYFFESYNDRVFKELTGHLHPFIQDNEARSVKNVLHGLHVQNNPTPQSKLVLEGVIWDGSGYSSRKQDIRTMVWRGTERRKQKTITGASWVRAWLQCAERKGRNPVQVRQAL